jgi:hypothetical protein
MKSPSLPFARCWRSRTVHFCFLARQPQQQQHQQQINPETTTTLLLLFAACLEKINQLKMAANAAAAAAAAQAAVAAGANNANAANAAGAAGGRPTNEHVEFSVRALEDLYLEGNLKTIRRVTADTNYSCLMLKTQRFSSLFRHYAKYHGLRKDDLQYHFVNVLKNDDTPETVQLQRNDVIIVRTTKERMIMMRSLAKLTQTTPPKPNRPNTHLHRSRRNVTMIDRS